jgi:membrane-bound serine protease (ClpP class)
MPSLRVSLAFILPTSVTIGLVMAFVTTVAVRAQRSKVVTGEQGLRGEIGEAVTDVGVGDGQGKVFVHGEYWNARSSEPIERGRKVRVKAVRSMDLEVEPADR